MRTTKNLKDVILEITYNLVDYKAQYGEEVDDIKRMVIQRQISVCENRIHDLSIALELTKKNEELVKILLRTRALNLKTYDPNTVGGLLHQEIETALKNNEL